MSRNAKHQAAVEATGVRIHELRDDIRSTLRRILEQANLLEDLADTRQSMPLGFQPAEAKAVRAKQDAADRRAARTAASSIAEEHLGLDWTRGTPSRTGAMAKPPVTMPPVSMLAEITFTIAHHVWKLGKHGNPARAAADVAAAEQADNDRGYCPWPRRPIATVRIQEDAGIAHQANHLAALIAGYKNRQGLETILRDLEQLEDRAADVIDGPASTNHPEPCPWCGRMSLVVHHRSKGRDQGFIRCEGTHPCRCDFENCECARNPIRYRHEWVNTGRATHTWTQLRNLQTTRKEIERLETLATDAIARIRELHVEIHLLRWAADCLDPEAHQKDWVDHPDLAAGDLLCERCEPIATVCDHCYQLAPADYTATAGAWPCPTIRALEPPEDNAEQGDSR